MIVHEYSNSKNVTSANLAAQQRNDAAYRLGVQDAETGHYRPTAYYHYSDARIVAYDAGHASVCDYPWRWSDEVGAGR